MTLLLPFAEGKKRSLPILIGALLIFLRGFDNTLLAAIVVYSSSTWMYKQGSDSLTNRLESEKFPKSEVIRAAKKIFSLKLRTGDNLQLTEFRDILILSVISGISATYILYVSILYLVNLNAPITNNAYLILGIATFYSAIFVVVTIVDLVHRFVRAFILGFLQTAELQKEVNFEFKTNDKTE